MRYLIQPPDGEAPFFTNWFDYENNYVDGMVVYDLRKEMYTRDGYSWVTVQRDNL